MGAYNIWNKWDKLETTLLGTCHPLEFWDNIKTDKIRDPLLRITEETLQELDYFKSVLKDFGCEVIQTPTLYDDVENWMEKKSLPRNSLQPRDAQLVMGEKLLFTQMDNPVIMKTLREYNSKDILLEPKFFQNHFTDKHAEMFLAAPCMTVVGDKVFIDTMESTPEGNLLVAKHFPEFEIVPVTIGGHNDSCFHTLKPGVILSLNDIQQYEETFPGWDVCYLPNQSWDKVEEWSTIKSKTRGKWWVPGEEHNDELINFVDTWLSDWVGYVEETVFDVNVFVLDEHHVCVSNDKNETVNAFLKKHKMEPVHIPWRHRYFWDGGLHCITLDLKRQGKQRSYF